jgi:uncharacterized phage-associated protein
MASYSARDVAFEIRKRLPGVPVKKLHKLLYYCQGWHVGTFGVPLFSEALSAWDMGPVVGQLWYAEKQHGPADEVQKLDEAALNTIGFVLSRYGGLSGMELERLTHSEPPWIDADGRRHPHGSQRIELEALARYFKAAPGEEEEGQEPELDPAAVSEWLAGAQNGPPAGRFKADTPDSLRALLSR